MSNIKILALAGSVRKSSYNGRLLAVAAAAASQHGATVTRVDLADYPLPLFDEDLEKETGTPENVKRLQELFLEHHALLIASPEYNSSITPLLKNVIDWVSRPIPQQPPLAAYRGKFAALLSASPGALGGLRGLVHLRAILGNIGVVVLPEQFALVKANEAFGDDGTLINPTQQQAVAAVVEKLVALLQRLNPTN